METHNQDKPQSSAHINDKNKIIINNNNNGDANLTQFVPLDLSGGGDDHDKMLLLEEMIVQYEVKKEYK